MGRVGGAILAFGWHLGDLERHTSRRLSYCEELDLESEGRHGAEMSCGWALAALVLTVSRMCLALSGTYGPKGCGGEGLCLSSKCLSATVSYRLILSLDCKAGTSSCPAPRPSVLC